MCLSARPSFLPSSPLFPRPNRLPRHVALSHFRLPFAGTADDLPRPPLLPPSSSCSSSSPPSPSPPHPALFLARRSRIRIPEPNLRRSEEKWDGDWIVIELSEHVFPNRGEMIKLILVGKQSLRHFSPVLSCCLALLRLDQRTHKRCSHHRLVPPLAGSSIFEGRRGWGGAHKVASEAGYLFSVQCVHVRR